MSLVWLCVVPVGIIALLFVLKAVRDVGRSVGKLVTSMNEMSEATTSLSQLREELEAKRPAADEVPPQAGPQ